MFYQLRQSALQLTENLTKMDLNEGYITILYNWKILVGEMPCLGVS